MRTGWVVDLQHFLAPSGAIADMPAPARRLAEYFASIVVDATSNLDEPPSVRCRRRPGRRRCTGIIFSVPSLEEPLTLPSGLVLPNRIAKAPMTENLADADNQPTVRHERAYRRWAQGGAGLLVTGNLMVDRRYLERSRNIVADSYLDIARLARVKVAVGATPLIAQLGHPGRQTNRFIATRPVAPSEGDAVRMLGLFAAPIGYG